MAALCARARAWLSPLILSALFFLLSIFTPVAAAPASVSGDTITVFLDQARVINLPPRANTVVIGNPLVADLSIQTYKNDKLAVITGKGYGETNVIVFDADGVELMTKSLQVTGPSDPTVVVYRGVDRETYSCTPDCSRRLTLGDEPEFFDKTLNQITTRNNQAVSAGALNTGR